MVETQLALPASPLAPGRSPARIRVREEGRGAPVIVLHGAWGYEIYPFDRQIAALGGRRRFVIPDRTGYGGSDPIDVQRAGFHQYAQRHDVGATEDRVDRRVLVEQTGQRAPAVAEFCRGFDRNDRYRRAAIEDGQCE